MYLKGFIFCVTKEFLSGWLVIGDMEWALERGTSVAKNSGAKPVLKALKQSETRNQIDPEPSALRSVGCVRSVR